MTVHSTSKYVAPNSESESIITIFSVKTIRAHALETRVTPRGVEQVGLGVLVSDEEGMYCFAKLL